MSVHTWLTDTPLEVADVLARVGTHEDGAVALFLGTVRRSNAGRDVVGMRYDAYLPMAERVLAAIAAEAVERMGEGSVAAAHRVGEVPLGGASVAIAVASPHRAEAFDACRYVIEEIKVRLPVWKLERYTDGTEAWLGGAPPPAPEPAETAS